MAQKYGIEEMIGTLKHNLTDANNFGKKIHTTGIPENTRYEIKDLLKKAETTLYDTERAIISNAVYALLLKAEEQAKDGIDPKGTINSIKTLAADYQQAKGGNWTWLDKDEVKSIVQLIRAEYHASIGEINPCIEQLKNIPKGYTQIYGLSTDKINSCLNTAKDTYSSSISFGSDMDPDVAMLNKNMAKVHADDLWEQAKKERNNRFSTTVNKQPEIYTVRKNMVAENISSQPV